MPQPGDAAHRDLHCVCCDRPLFAQADMRRLVPEHLANQHHRVLGNTKDNRLGNKILLYGSGTQGCHGRWHNHDRTEAERLGYIIRHGQFSATPMVVPVWYQQPSMGRIGWHLITDAGGWIRVDADPAADAMDLAAAVVAGMELATGLDLAHEIARMESDPT